MSLEPLHRPILFSEPDRAVWPPSWIGHIPFAFWIVEALRPETLVELGTHTGNSFSAFCQAVGTLGLPTRCFAIDTWTGDPQAGYYGDAVYDELAPYLQSQYPSARLLRMTFDEALPDFADGSVDLLHIDGFHSYEAVLHDFTTWLPKLSRRGVVLFHDVTVRLEGYEVWKFWDEVSRQYPSFIFAHSNGLGVLLVGAEVPAAVRWLVDATDGREEIRQFFGCLGHRLVSVYNDQEQRRLIDRQQRLIEDNVKTHYQETENRDREIHRLNGVVATASEDLIALGRMVNDRDAELARQDAEIRELNTAVQTVRAETAAVRDELAGRESEIARLDSALGLARSQIAAVHDQLVGRDALTSTLKAPAPVARGLRTRLRRLVRATGRRLLEVLPGSLTTRIRWRWQEGVIRSSGLFDGAFYLETCPEAALSGLDPLVHYLRHGAANPGGRLHPLFDPVFYLESYPEVRAAGLNPLIHYLRHGAAEGRRPHPLFDPAFYLESHPEVGAAGFNPLVHYLRHGAAEGCRPHPLFDPAFYLESCPEVGAAGLNPLVHYLRRGAAEGRWPHPLFDPAFYLESCPEVDAAGLNPLVHYLRQGAAEGRWPNPLFDPAFYLESCPEVGAVGLNPLIHYLRHGAAEGRWPNPLFDPAFYLKTYPDVQAAGMAPLVHYLRHGAAQGRWPNPLFDGVFYLESHPEVAAAGLNPLHHYLRYGAALGYRTNLLFDPAFYLESYPDVSAAGMAPLVHYLRHGTAEGRRPNPLFDGAWYLEYYPEVKAAGLNPLYHYLRWGAAEGRWSSRQFHGGFYLETYPEVAAAGLNPLCHYLGQGAAEGRRTRRSRRCDLRPQSRPMLPDPAAAPALLPFAVPAPAPGRETAVSIVIPVRTGGLTEGLTCLYRLGRRPPARPVQVIAVFPEGDADTAGALARVDGLVLAPVPAGTATAAACNHGAGRADGTRLVFLSPDVLVEAGWLDELVWSLDRLPEAGLVGALVVGADGWIEAEGGTLRRDGSVTLEGRGCDPALPEHGHARTVCWCPAGALIITATLFRRLGGFETACWAAARPELALAVAVRVAGLKVYCQSTARVVRLPAGDAAPRPNTLWPAAIRVPRTDPRWAALLDRSPAPALPEIEQERALGRRHLLVIDRALPVIDREPSGLAALMLLFFGLGYRVTFATPALPRDHGPEVRALERRGIHVLRQQADISVLSFLGRDEIAIDLLLFAHPGVAALFLPEIAELAAARMLAAAGLATDSRGRRLFVPEVVGLPTASSRVLLAGGLELPGLDLPEAGRDGWHQGRAGLALLREMVLTVVGNETERDALRQAAPDCPTLVMPPVIPVPDAGAGAPTGFAGPDISVGFADRHDLILPGRFEEWPDGEAVVAFVLDEWPQLRARLPGARLVILAMDTTVPPVIRALQSAEILVREGLDQAGAVLAGARLAVAPHRSWCGFHPAVAAVLARGVPAVLSPSVARGLGLAVDGSERVAEPGTAFVDRVAAVWDDQSLLARLAADGVRQATASWSAGAVRQRLIQLLHRARLTPTYDMSEQIARQALAAKGTLG